ncbi:uncharacterized protein LOC143046433 [Mytilus galloprovincialis]|uniref:uncharacterized protein LOC143046433 n=1 Tax=Mytilus galloprovincialis TaxID=29158 RepID=UPI003F7B47AB
MKAIKEQTHLNYCRQSLYVKNGFAVCDPEDKIYGSICKIYCNDGYQLTSDSVSTKNCEGTSFSSGKIECENAEPPEFVNCPTSIIRYADRGSDVATNVTWNEPIITDNSQQGESCGDQSNPLLEQVEGLPHGSDFSAGFHLIKYEATDGNGLTSFCSFTVIIEIIKSIADTIQLYFTAISCDPLMPSDTFLISRCPTGYTYGSICRRNPNLLVKPGELIYFYSGDCSDTTVQQGIKENFITVMEDLAYNRNWSNICPTSCNISDVTVTCGPTTGRRRRDIEGTYFKRLFIRSTNEITLTFSLTMQWIEGGDYWANDDEIVGVSEILEEMSKNGDLIYNGLSPATIAFSFSSMGCEEGSAPDYYTDTCSGCAPGTHLLRATEECKKCAIGFYQDEEYQASCKQCPTGMSTENVGSSSLSDCKEIYLSGLVLHTNITSYIYTRTCTPATTDEIYTMSDFLTIEKSDIELLESQCDEINECISNPCGDGNICYNKKDGYNCNCLNGYRGSKCQIPPDFCIGNNCTNGATCESQQANYTCQCASGFKGPFCKKEIVNGGWSSYSGWYECSKSCEGGTRSRVRFCDSPAPDPEGQFCIGSDTEVGNCNTDPCPVACPTGTYWSDGFCRLCPVGTYQNETGQQGCEACPNGYTTLYRSSRNITDCSENNTSVTSNSETVTTSSTSTTTSTFSGTSNGVSKVSNSPDVKEVDEEDISVNGGWSSWFGWSECSKSCDGGNRSRVRFCDNPHPEPDGQVCVGSDTGVGNCNEDSCPVCKPYYEIKQFKNEFNCTIINDHISCTVTCKNGYVFLPEHRPNDKYECGTTTNYVWSGTPPACAQHNN